MKKVSGLYILGVKYTVIVGDKEDLPEVWERGNYGETDRYQKVIRVVTNFVDEEKLGADYPEHARKSFIMETLTHEVTHAFIKESGMKLSEDIEESLCEWVATMLPHIGSCLLEDHAYNTDFIPKGDD